MLIETVATLLGTSEQRIRQVLALGKLAKEFIPGTGTLLFRKRQVEALARMIGS